tara:strand:+ start:7243 stop:8109 length:867 start_codon:yes stop_codon:yes gene_type:complete
MDLTQLNAYYFGTNVEGSPCIYSSYSEYQQNVCGKMVQNKSGSVPDAKIISVQFSQNGWPKSIVIEVAEKIIVNDNQQSLRKKIRFITDASSEHFGRLEKGYICPALGLHADSRMQFPTCRRSPPRKRQREAKTQNYNTTQTTAQRHVQSETLKKIIAAQLVRCIEKYKSDEEFKNHHLEQMEIIKKMIQSLHAPMQDDTLTFKDEFIKKHGLEPMSDEHFKMWMLCKETPPDDLKKLSELSHLREQNSLAQKKIQERDLKIKSQDEKIEQIASKLRERELAQHQGVA